MPALRLGPDGSLWWTVWGWTDFHTITEDKLKNNIVKLKKFF